MRTELTSLAQKHLVSRVEEGDESHHRFQHIMIRDTAYDGILKRARADFHERFVVWADEVNRDRGAEFEEILGYHLEQAWTYLSELGPLDDHGPQSGRTARADSRRQAGARFARRRPGRGVTARTGRDAPPDDHPERLAPAGPWRGAPHDRSVRGGVRGARGGDRQGGRRPCGRGARHLVRLLVRLRTGADGWRPDTVEEEIEATISIFEQAGDEAGLAMAWRLLAWAAGTACCFGDAAEALPRRRACRRAGDIRQERRAATYAASVSLGPTLVDEAIDPKLGGGDGADGGGSPVGGRPPRGAGRACTRCRAKFDHARGLAARSRTVFEELGLQMETARLRDGTPARSSGSRGTSTALRRSSGRPTTRSTRSASGSRCSTVAGFLAQTLLRAGRAGRGERLLRPEPRPLRPSGHATQALWCYVRGRILARQGAAAEAETIANEAIELLEATDAIVYQIEARVALGEALVAGGRIGDARDALESARDPGWGEGRRRDPVRRAPPSRGSRRRPDDERERLAHQFHGPFVGALAMMVQTAGLLPAGGGMIWTTQP